MTDNLVTQICSTVCSAGARPGRLWRYFPRRTAVPGSSVESW